MDPTSIVALLPYAPPWAEHVLAWLAIAVTAAALLGYALDAALPALRRKAAASETRADDRVVAWLGGAAAVLSLLSAVLPRMRFGERRPRPELSEAPHRDATPTIEHPIEEEGTEP